jgi:chaperonin GroES
MRIKPLRDRVAVKFKSLEEEEKKTESGIVLPETAKKDEKPQQGEVTAVGNECCNDDGEPVVEVGDTVVFDKFAGTEVTLEDEDFIILSLDDLLAVLG